jgi:hypothetical protein
MNLFYFILAGAVVSVILLNVSFKKASIEEEEPKIEEPVIKPKRKYKKRATKAPVKRKYVKKIKPVE